MADEMCDEAYRRESDDTQGILWPFCHHSENEANTLDRTELGEEKRKSYTQDSRPIFYDFFPPVEFKNPNSIIS